MAAKGQMTGMLGVFLTAAELTSRDFIVSVTSRSARGVDLFATDHDYKRTWSIQVKTNRKVASFWLLNKNFSEEVSKQHVYIFVNMRGDLRPDYYIVPSAKVAKFGRITPPGQRPNSIWYSFFRMDGEPYKEAWTYLSKPQK
jgi:hypothetical protein